MQEENDKMLTIEYRKSYFSVYYSYYRLYFKFNT